MYKTRGNSSPQGKPRVYFCCHPKDFSLYFDSLKEEIFELKEKLLLKHDMQAHFDNQIVDEVEEIVCINDASRDNSSKELAYVPFAIW